MPLLSSAMRDSRTLTNSCNPTLNTRIVLMIVAQPFCFNIHFSSSELLPSPPEDVEVEALTERSLKVSWSFPTSNSETITNYSVNATSLRTFDERILDPNEGVTNKPTTIMSHTVNVNVPASQNSTVLGGLAPFTMYEVPNH